MLNTVLNGSARGYLICIIVSLISGFFLSLVYKKTEHSTRSFLITIALLPITVMLVIMLVNGNIGVGVAVAGSFALVRFRSLPGKASDILIVFMAMAVGLCTGMGYAAVALISTAIGVLLYWIYAETGIFHEDPSFRSLRITIPESLDYTTVFDDIFKEYTKSHFIETVRTTNMGTMFQITYQIQLSDVSFEKKMIDAIRIRNGNLPVISSTIKETPVEL